MIYKVRLQQEITLNVEATSEEEVWDWMLCTTPDEAAALFNGDCNYCEEIVCEIPDDITPDYSLK